MILIQNSIYPIIQSHKWWLGHYDWFIQGWPFIWLSTSWNYAETGEPLTKSNTRGCSGVGIKYDISMVSCQCTSNLKDKIKESHFLKVGHRDGTVDAICQNFQEFATK